MSLGIIDHVAISVSRLNSSVEWYQRVLGLERRFADVWEGPPIMLCTQGSCLALFQTESQEPASLQDHKSVPLIWHIAFKVDRKAFDESKHRFHELGVAYRVVNHDVCHSIYISDADGHQIELVTYETTG
jgi:catechol 2,3-dioxygenase-like lactoylglutathione lyase family enzyme